MFDISVSFEENGQLEVDFASKISFWKKKFGFDFHWLSKELSKVENNFRKQRVSKNKINQKMEETKKCSPKWMFFNENYQRDLDVFWHWKLTLKVRFMPFNFWWSIWNPVKVKWKKSRSLFSKIHQSGPIKISVHFPDFIELSKIRLQKDFVLVVLGYHRCFEGRAFEMSNSDSLDETHRTADNPV